MIDRLYSIPDTPDGLYRRDASVPPEFRAQTHYMDINRSRIHVNICSPYLADQFFSCKGLSDFGSEASIKERARSWSAECLVFQSVSRTLIDQY